MRGVILICLLPLSVGQARAEVPKPALSPAQITLAAMTTCRQEPSSLLRLDCYDHLLTPAYPDFSGALVKAQVQGEAWQRAFTQENLRDDHSANFLTQQTSGEPSSVVITTPAIGIVPPRPVLMFSCIDNITRMQIALSEPLHHEPNLSISTEKFHADVHWFLRENDSLLESSRGLPGIDEIKQLFGASTLTIALNKADEGISAKSEPATLLTFSIDGLDKTLTPLKVACHWAD
jgi:type VI secretion system protein VasI